MTAYDTYRDDRGAQIDVPYPPHRSSRQAGDVRLAPPVSQPVALPVGVPSYVLSAWSPGGEPATLSRNQEATRRLCMHLDAMALAYRRALSYSPDRSWVEESVVVDDLSDTGAVALGRLLSSLLGCAVCGDGARATGREGRPVLLSGLYLPSRWGGWQFDR